MSERPYSAYPQTPCTKGGKHRGRILDRCEKCGTLLTYMDFCLELLVVFKKAVGPRQHLAPPSGQTIHKAVEIKCQEPGCGATRLVKPQDVWQVKRCVPCQKAHQMNRFKERLNALKARRPDPQVTKSAFRFADRTNGKDRPSTRKSQKVPVSNRTR